MDGNTFIKYVVGYHRVLLNIVTTTNLLDFHALRDHVKLTMCYSDFIILCLFWGWPRRFISTWLTGRGRVGAGPWHSGTLSR